MVTRLQCGIANVITQSDKGSNEERECTDAKVSHREHLMKQSWGSLQPTDKKESEVFFRLMLLNAFGSCKTAWDPHVHKD